MTVIAVTRRSQGQAHSNGVRVLTFERQFGVAPESLMNHWLVQHRAWTLVASYFYNEAVFAVTAATALWVWLRDPDVATRARNELSLALLACFGLFAVAPVAPPRLLHAGFVGLSNAAGYGPALTASLVVQHADHDAAFPSMHVLAAAWCLLVALRMRSGRRGRFVVWLLGSGNVIATVVVVMSTGDHYLSDAIAAAAVLAGATGLVGWWSGRRHSWRMARGEGACGWEHR